MFSARSAVCVSPAEVPVNVTVALPTGADEDVDIVTLSATPGVKVKVAGETVTPFGKPLIATSTVPLKPFTAVARTAIAWLEFPCTMSSLVGEIVREKSSADCAAVTFNARNAVWLSAPEAPVKATACVPMVAFAAAVNVTVADAPGVKANVAGDAVTPLGRPLIETAMLPAKPVLVAAWTVTNWLPPSATDRLVGASVRLKSCGGGGEMIVSPNVAVCCSVPPVPVSRTV